MAQKNAIDILKNWDKIVKTKVKVIDENKYIIIDDINKFNKTTGKFGKKVIEEIKKIENNGIFHKEDIDIKSIIRGLGTIVSIPLFLIKYLFFH